MLSAERLGKPPNKHTNKQPPNEATKQEKPQLASRGLPSMHPSSSFFHLLSQRWRDIPGEPICVWVLTFTPDCSPSALMGLEVAE